MENTYQLMQILDPFLTGRDQIQLNNVKTHRIVKLSPPYLGREVNVRLKAESYLGSWGKLRASMTYRISPEGGRPSEGAQINNKGGHE